MWLAPSRSLARVSALALALPLAVPAAAAPRHAFRIVSLNDVYSLEPVPTPVAGGAFEPRGGLVHAASVVERLRRQGPVLVLHAGDFLSPSLLSNRLRHQGAQMVEALNALRPGLVTFGNHEFDFGCAALADRLRESRFAWVSANVRLPSGLGLSPGRVGPWRVVEVAGLRVGVFGLTVPLEPVGGCGPEPIRFGDPLAAARGAVAALERRRVDLVVALTHQAMADDVALARALPRIDVIVGGHDHEGHQKLVGRTLIVKAPASATEVAVVSVEAARDEEGLLVAKSHETLAVDPATAPPHPRLLRVAQRYEAELRPYAEVIGATSVPLDVREDVVRGRESNFANLVADAARAAVGADVALLNGGSFRADRVLPPGPVTLGDLWDALPFENEVVAIDVTGSEIRKALENGVSLFGQRAGRFPHVSGLRFTLDPALPPGRRVVQVVVGERALEDGRSYVLATTAFLAEPGGIDGYDLPQRVLRRGGTLEEAVRRAFAAGPVAPAVEGRLRARD